MNFIPLTTLVAAVALCGCGASSAGVAKPKVKPAAAKGARPNQPAQLRANPVEYASLDAAFSDVEKMAADPLGGQKLLGIERWLDRQGEKIVPELKGRIEDPAVGLATRLTACRVLARLGPVATPTLLAATTGEPKQLRLKAIQSLGRVQPTSDEIVSKLLAFVDEPDFETRKAALGGLQEIGPAAKSAVQKLMSVLNDTQEDETIRSLAKSALLTIEPRRGLMNAQ